MLSSTMVTMRHAILTILVVLMFHAWGVLWLYEVWQWYDIPMHAAGGFAMGLVGLALWNQYVKKVTLRVHGREPFLILFVLLGFVALIGIGWEWFEFFVDAYFVDVKMAWGMAQPSIGDTLADLFFDLTGGVVAMILLNKV